MPLSEYTTMILWGGGMRKGSVIVYATVPCNMKRTYKILLWIFHHWHFVFINENVMAVFPHSKLLKGTVAQWVRLLDYLTTHTSLSPMRRGFAPSFVDYKKGCTRLTAASDKVYQLLAHGRFFFPGTPASSTTTTGPHGIAEILLKVALKHQQSKSNKKTKLMTSHKVDPTEVHLASYVRCTVLHRMVK